MQIASQLCQSARYPRGWSMKSLPASHSVLGGHLSASFLFFFFPGRGCNLNVTLRPANIYESAQLCALHLDRWFQGSSLRSKHINKWGLHHVHTSKGYLFTRHKTENAHVLRKEDPQQGSLAVIHSAMYAMLLNTYIKHIYTYICMTAHKIAC